MRSAWQAAAAYAVLALGMLLCIAVYLPGLSGGFLFDDYPNIVDNHGVQPEHLDFASLVAAALSSPSSELKRPLASLTFAANFLATGMTAGPMKVTNLAIHLINGLLAFLFIRELLRAMFHGRHNPAIVAAAIATTWMLLPINLTAVLYVVQRMESLANIFILLGLWAYVRGRLRMQSTAHGAGMAAIGVLAGSAVGLLCKESAVATPLFAAVIEAIVFRGLSQQQNLAGLGFDRRVPSFFLLFLIVPGVIGLCWLVPSVLSPASWATRDFTLETRLLSEARIIVSYIGWTLIPLPSELSFYHDQFVASASLLDPPSTLLGLCALIAITATAVLTVNRRPLLSLSITLYLCAHLLTGTVLPLELIYEHRNYFPSLPVLLALAGIFLHGETRRPTFACGVLLMACVAIVAATETHTTAVAWGTPLGLSRELARRAPDSPRALYELGRAYIIDSHYDPESPSAALVYAPLEQAAALARSTILPLQALIFFNARMHRPVNDEWWQEIDAKLAARRPVVEDESSLIALSQCMQSMACDLSRARMHAAFDAAISHPRPSGRLLSAFADFAWRVEEDLALGESLQRRAVDATPNEVAYRMALIRLQIARKHFDDASRSLEGLAERDVLGTAQNTIAKLDAQLAAARDVQAHAR